MLEIHKCCCQLDEDIVFLSSSYGAIFNAGLTLSSLEYKDSVLKG